MSPGEKYWNPQKGLVTKNTHVKYQISSSHCSKVTRKVIFLLQKVDKTPRSKSLGQKNVTQ